MTYKSSAILAWILYAGIILLELLTDYLIRKFSTDFYSAGMTETLWFLIQIFAAAVGAYFIFRGSKFLETIKQKLIYFSVNLVFGIIFYFLAVYSYVLGLGIDSL